VAEEKVARRWRTWHLLTAVVVSLVVGGAVGAAIASGDDNDNNSNAAIPAATAVPASTTTVRAATTKPTASTTTTIKRSTNSRENPVPKGEPAKVGAWTVRVLDVMPNANTAIAAANQFNDPPKPGQQFFMAKVELTYNGDEQTATPFDVSLKAVGQSNVAYSTFENTCGVVPDSLPSGELFKGGIATGNVCWAIASSDATSLVMSAEEAFAFDSRKVFFALK